MTRRSSTWKRPRSSTSKTEGPGAIAASGPPTFFALGLGVNLGPAEETLRHAIHRLELALGPLAVGGLYRSLPRSPIPQPPFLNTAVAGTTRLAPEALLALGKELEREAGREPGPRYGPRPLDVDLLVYGALVLEAPALTVPHPRLRERRFALAPLADVAAGFALPPDGVRVAELLAAVGQESEVERLAWAIMPTAPKTHS